MAKVVLSIVAFLDVIFCCSERGEIMTKFKYILPLALLSACASVEHIKPEDKAGILDGSQGGLVLSIFEVPAPCSAASIEFKNVDTSETKDVFATIVHGGGGVINFGQDKNDPSGGTIKVIPLPAGRYLPSKGECTSYRGSGTIVNHDFRFTELNGVEPVEIKPGFITYPGSYGFALQRRGSSRLIFTYVDESDDVDHYIKTILPEMEPKLVKEVK